MIVFVDGSSTKAADGSSLSGYAVCSESDILESGKLPRHYSAQQAELCPQIAACNLTKDRSIATYTDSRYAYRMAHDVGALWKIRGYITSQGMPVKNDKLIAELLEAIHLAKQIAIVKCRAHTKQRDMVSKGKMLSMI